MGFKVSKDLTVNNILQVITEYDIFKTYCTPFTKIDKLFTSELRQDNNPTCKIFVNSKNTLIYHDFNGNSHNCFTYIGEKFSVDFNTVLNIINADFNLGLRSTWHKDIVTTDIKPKLTNKKKLKFKKTTTLQKRRRKWQKQDKEYWYAKYKIHSSTLDYFDTEPIDYYWVNYNMFKCTYPTYSYEFGDGARDIYSPLNPIYKWPASTTKANKHIYGYKQLPKTGDVVFVVSSNKEVMFLYELDIVSVAPQSESTFLPEWAIEDLKNRFKRVIIMFDFDKAGCTQAAKWANKYKLEYMKFCPVMIAYYKAKDLTDAFEIDNNKILNLLNIYEKYI